MNSLAVRARTISDRIALAAGLDVRLLGMLSVMAAVWLALHVLTGGLFLTPRNLFNLSLQVSVVGIITCGMVLVIVSRHIDLSVGSQIGFIGKATSSFLMFARRPNTPSVIFPRLFSPIPP